MPYQDTRNRQIQETHFYYDSKSSFSYNRNYNTVWIYFNNNYGLIFNRIFLIISNLYGYITTNRMIKRYN